MWKDDPQGVFPDPQSIGMASRVQARTLHENILAAYDYVHDIFLGIEKEQRPAALV